MVAIMPCGPVEDAVHAWSYRSDEQCGGFVESCASGDDPECWLCRRGVCVRRHFYFADGGLLIVHGTFEA